MNASHIKNLLFAFVMITSVTTFAQDKRKSLPVVLMVDGAPYNAKAGIPVGFKTLEFKLDFRDILEDSVVQFVENKMEVFLQWTGATTTRVRGLNDLNRVIGQVAPGMKSGDLFYIFNSSFGEYTFSGDWGISARKKN